MEIFRLIKSCIFFGRHIFCISLAEAIEFGMRTLVQSICVVFVAQCNRLELLVFLRVNGGKNAMN